MTMPVRQLKVSSIAMPFRKPALRSGRPMAQANTVKAPGFSSISKPDWIGEVLKRAPD
jgi:hypothetical protein